MTLKLKFKFIGEPKAIQSARFASIGGHMRSYQPKENKDWKSWIRVQAMNQLPSGWVATDEPVTVERLLFVFSPLKSHYSKKLLREHLKIGGMILKDKKPDLSDNLAKGMMDALEGIVFVNDSRIWRIKESAKVYGESPRIELTLGGGGEDMLIEPWEI